MFLVLHPKTTCPSSQNHLSCITKPLVLHPQTTCPSSKNHLSFIPKPLVLHPKTTCSAFKTTPVLLHFSCIKKIPLVLHPQTTCPISKIQKLRLIGREILFRLFIGSTPLTLKVTTFSCSFRPVSL